MPKRKSRPPTKSRKPASKAARSGKRSTARGSKGITVKVFVVLEALVASAKPMSIPELIEGCGLKTATAHRLTKMLLELGLIEKDAERRFCEGKRTVDLAFATVAAAARRSARRNVIEKLARDAGEIAHFSVQDGGSAVCVDHADLVMPLGVRLQKGMQLPMHCTAAGKLLLALMPSPAREKLLGSLELTPFTERTITRPDKLAAEMERIVRDRVSMCNEEFDAGVVAVAVPVYSGEKLLGALSLAAPRARKSLAQMQALVPLLNAAAERLGTSY